MLVEVRVDLQRRSVQSGFVRERAGSDPRLVRVRRDVGQFRDRVADPDEVGKGALRQDRLPLLQLEGRDDSEQVRVAGTLAVAVGRPLHVRRARVDGRERVRNCARGVVVRVDAHPHPLAGKLVHDVGHTARQHAAVRVAQRDHVSPCVVRRPYHRERVVAVQKVAVEEVFGVEEDTPALAAQELDGVADHREVFLAGRPQRALDMSHVRLGHEGHHRRLRVDECTHLRVVGGHRPGLAGRAEGSKLRVPEGELPGGGTPEERLVLRVCAGPSTLDEADPEVVEVRRNGELVLDRQRQPLPLRAVAERRVVDVQRLTRVHPVPSTSCVAQSCVATKKPPMTVRSAGAARRRWS